MGFVRLKGVGLSVYRTAGIFKASRQVRSGLVWGLGLGVYEGSQGLRAGQPSSQQEKQQEITLLRREA